MKTTATQTAPHDKTASKGRPPLSLGVWAIAFACAVSYMGIGLVDPILPAISRSLRATPSQAELLFTTYLFVTAAVMFVSSTVASWIGRKRTMLLGLGLVVAFALSCALADYVGLIIAFRGGWGIGNALFVSTALAAIIGATADTSRAIILYEAALGVGLAVGPLVGGMLGQISWRGPFLGTSFLMAIAFIGIAVALRGPEEPAPRRPVKAAFVAMGHPGFRIFLVATALYNFSYFTLLAYAPFPLDHASRVAGSDFTPLDLGLVFFGWGTLLAVGSVLVAPRMTRTIGLRRTLYLTLGALTITEACLAFSFNNLSIQLVGTIVGGGLIGIANTAMTEAAMEATDLPRLVASSSYSGTRFLGGAVAPTVAGPLSEAFNVGAPYVVGAIACLATVVILRLDRQRLGRPHETAVDEATIISRAD